jgi:hypothetical protein
MEDLSVSEIQDMIIEEKETHPELDTFNSDSMYAKWRMWTFVTAKVFRTIVSRFITFIADAKELIAREKPGRTRWYAEKAKLFQYGYSVVEDQDYYDNTGIDDSLVTASRVVKYAACVDVGSRLRIKIAGVTDGSLAPIGSTQFDAFKSYMENDVKYAGVRIEYVNSVPDELKLSYDIYYDPSVLDADGKRLDGTNDTPVQTAINNYLVNKLRFDGVFVTASLTDELQKVDGVKVPALQLAQARYGTLPFANIVDFYNPDAGYLRIAPSGLTLNFIKSPI